MIVVTNNIPVNSAFEADFEDRFSHRVHLVDRAPGFIRNEVHRPKAMRFSHSSGKWEHDKNKQGFYQIKTWWRSFEDFENWTKSEAFAIAHKNRAPQEMFAGASHLDVHELFLSTDLMPSSKDKQTAKAAKNNVSGTVIVVTNNIPVNSAFEADFEDRFSHRVHLVDRAPGFIRNEVHRPTPMKFSHSSGKWEEDKNKQGFYQIKTWWRSFEDFENWTKSEAFAIAHKNRAPQEMFAGASHLDVHELFLSTDLLPALERKQQKPQQRQQQKPAKRSSPEAGAKIDPKKLPKMTIDELGSHKKPPSIYISLKGFVFDVTPGAEFYGPGGPYAVLAGHDASCALAKSSLEREHLDADWRTSLSSEEQTILSNWFRKFSDKYRCVAVVPKYLALPRSKI